MDIQDLEHLDRLDCCKAVMAKSFRSLLLRGFRP